MDTHRDVFEVVPMRGKRFGKPLLARKGYRAIMRAIDTVVPGGYWAIRHRASNTYDVDGDRTFRTVRGTLATLTRKVKS